MKKFCALAFASTQVITSTEKALAAETEDSLRVGWSMVDITPGKPVFLAGYSYARVSEGVEDPVSATVLALESPRDGTEVVMVSCDLLNISDSLRDSVRRAVSRAVPELSPQSILMMATHTHNAPYAGTTIRYRPESPPDTDPYGIDVDVIDPVDYVSWASERIADAAVRAWNNRSPGGVAYGLSHAVVGQNRLVAYASGQSQMYGKPNKASFRHIEGYEDHSLNILATYNQGKLSGLVLNIACPSQVGSAFMISADFWHDVRAELRSRLGNKLFILAQTAAAGDQSPQTIRNKAAQYRMLSLARRSWRHEIATRIADAVINTLPLIEKEIDFAPRLQHHVDQLELPRRFIPEDDMLKAKAAVVDGQRAYREMLVELKADPALRARKQWYVDISRAHRAVRRQQNVIHRFTLQQNHPTFTIETHAVRLGDVAFVSNPFELYLDYGIQIQERSPATQTFVIQLAGPGSYLPTKRSIAGGAYGAVPASTDAGPEGGETLVEWSVAALAELFKVEDLGLLPEAGCSWEFRIDPEGKGIESAWHCEAKDSDNWLQIPVPARWSQIETVGDYLGYGWYRTHFAMPKQLRGRSLRLHFGAVDEQAWVYLNGELVGEHSVESTCLSPGYLWDQEFTVDLPANVLSTEGENLLVVRVHSHKGQAGIYRPVQISLR